MLVFILGGTGNIGKPVLREVVRRGHSVFALARSEESANKVIALGATPILGDIREPESWIENLQTFDAVIQMAEDPSGSMEQIARPLLEKLFARLVMQGNSPKFIYTGGNLLFGNGETVANEQSPFHPREPFAWMVPNIEFTLQASGIKPIIIHPGMVYEPNGGVFSRFIRNARELNVIRVAESEDHLWPLVHSADIATLYALALERAPSGSSYIGVSLEGFPVGRIARAIARKMGLPNEAPRIVSIDSVVQELGSWARGPALNQRLSGEKARKELGWEPVYIDPEGEIASANFS